MSLAACMCEAGDEGRRVAAVLFLIAHISRLVMSSLRPGLTLPCQLPWAILRWHGQLTVVTLFTFMSSTIDNEFNFDLLQSCKQPQSFMQLLHPPWWIICPEIFPPGMTRKSAMLSLAHIIQLAPTI